MALVRRSEIAPSLSQAARQRACPRWAGHARPATGPAIGFTLVEMMVVIAIMAMLAAIIIPSYNVVERHQQRNSCAANLKAIGQALSVFREEYQCYPPDATEFLWTEEAAEEYRQRYGAYPSGDYRRGTPFGAAYDPDGNPIDTGVNGLGLYTLYYLGVYASVLPRPTVEPRLYDAEGRLLPGVDGSKGLNQFDWFRGSVYLTDLEFLHCPANQAKLDPGHLLWRQAAGRAGVPYLRGWGNYDMFYRRNFWHQGYRPGPGDDNRNLFQPYPPVDTVITWCPHHRSAKAPGGPSELSDVNPGDEDLVLFADGSVRRMVASKTNRVFEDPSGDFGYPQGPIM